CGQHVLGHADLLFTAGVVGATGTTVGLPGALRELQTAVVAVTGVDTPVAAALALRHGVPVVGRGGGGGQTGRNGDHGTGDSGEAQGTSGELAIERHKDSYLRPPARLVTIAVSLPLRNVGDPRIAGQAFRCSAIRFGSGCCSSRDRM